MRQGRNIDLSSRQMISCLLWNVQTRSIDHCVEQSLHQSITNRRHTLRPVTEHTRIAGGSDANARFDP